MSPLEIKRGERRIDYFEDDEELPRRKWTLILNIADKVFKHAVEVADIEVRVTEGPTPNMPQRNLTKVGDFPKIIQGLIDISKMPDKRTKIWLDRVDPQGDAFVIQSPSGLTLIFTKED